MTGTLAYQLRCGNCGSRDLGPHVCDLPTTKQAYAYRGPEPDCRTCAHCLVVQMAQAPDVACWQECTNADKYEPLPPVRLWRTT